MFSDHRITYKGFLFYGLHHSLSRRVVRNYMDKRGFYRNGAWEILENTIKLVMVREDANMPHGLRIKIRRHGMLSMELIRTLLFWIAEKSYLFF